MATANGNASIRVAGENGANKNSQSSLSSSITYEKIMGKEATTADGGTSETETATKALSTRLVTFRKWLTKDAKVQLHSAVCVVNGEATDGTRNAPVLTFEKVAPAGGGGARAGSGGGGGHPHGAHQQLSSSSSAASSAAAGSINAGRVGMVDWGDDQALYDRTMGCQVRAVREIKKDEVILTMPRGAMITPDLVAASDAGRAVLACCRPPAEASSRIEMGFWDAFGNTTNCEAKYNNKLVRNTAPQLLVKILQERKRAETAFNKRIQERRQSMMDNAGGLNQKPQLKYTLSEPETISTRAPLLAFLIHQRFAVDPRPPVESQTELANEQFQHILNSDDGNALKFIKAPSRPPGSPDTFAPYARTLPSSVSLPLCWKRSELALLASAIPGTAPLHEVAATTMQLAAEFISLLESGILERFPETFPEGILTWERWVWAAAIVASRNLPATSYINNGDKDASDFVPNDPLEFQSPAFIWNELGVLIPLLDMLNHEIDAHQVTWQPCVPEKNNLNAEEGAALVEDDGDDESNPSPHLPRAIVHKKVRKGAELFCCYGDLANVNLMLQYGFAQIGNRVGEVKLGWGLMDSVGHLDAPKDYTPPLKDDSYRRFYVYETIDEEESKKWWTDDRLKVLEKELFSSTSDNGFVEDLKNGKKMTTSAYADGTYHPILLTALVVASMPKIELQKFVSSKRENVVISKRHQQVLRSYLAFLFSRKLEKLLHSVSTGLKNHFGTLKLWESVSKGGLKYTHNPEEDQSSSSTDEYIGWQSFFDAHVYQAASMEVEKHYYAMGASSCVLALFDSQLRALQVSLDGVCDEDKFRDDVLQQLQDLGFGIATDKSESTGGGDQGNISSPGSDKKSPRNRKRNKNKSTTPVDSNVSNVVSSGGDNKPPAMKLHVGNLSFSTTPSDMYDYFCSLYGKDSILECHIPIERETGRSRGFGFVTMPEGLAAKVLESGQKHEMGGRLVKLARSNSAGTSNSGKARPENVAVTDRCGSCGYRPKYCTCGRYRPEPPGGPGPRGPNGPGPGPFGRGEPNGRWDDRDSSYYGSGGGDRHRDVRYWDGPGPPPPDYGYDRDVERDRYGRPYERDRYSMSGRFDDVPPARGGGGGGSLDGRHRELSSSRRESGRERSRSSGRRNRDIDDGRWSSSRRGDDDYERRKRSRSRSHSRERSRKRKSKRRTRSRSASSPRGN